MKSARIIALAGPAALVLTLGAVGAGLTSALPGKSGLSALVASLSAYVALGPLGTTPAETTEPPTQPSVEPPAPTGEAGDMSMVIGRQSESFVGLATVTVAAAAAPPTEPDPVDYARLKQDVQVVAETLERFNQKLLRIIAQARAEQLRAEAQAASESQPESGSDAAPVSPVQAVPVAPLEVEATR